MIDCVAYFTSTCSDPYLTVSIIVPYTDCNMKATYFDLRLLCE